MRRSLQTTAWTTAQLRLNGLLNAHRENRSKVAPPEFNEAVELFKRELGHDTSDQAAEQEIPPVVFGQAPEDLA